MRTRPLGSLRMVGRIAAKLSEKGALSGLVHFSKLDSVSLTSPIVESMSNLSGINDQALQGEMKERVCSFTSEPLFAVFPSQLPVHLQIA